MKLLFLCTGNSCRSILAEATFNLLAPKGWRAMSAGSHPTGEVHPQSVALLRRKGIPVDGYYSKSWNDLPSKPDVVITVCGNAADETCPAYLGSAVRSHWGVDDPARASGSEMEINAAFERAYHVLRLRIERFLSLPPEKIADAAHLKAELDNIGGMVE